MEGKHVLMHHSFGYRPTACGAINKSITQSTRGACQVHYFAFDPDGAFFG